ncbi:MAG: hypothetical protein MJZ68_03740 [archaeon]|nr:hypothetical protein [archaeon]
MAEIPVKSGMTLKLNHVLSREIGYADEQQALKVATLFDNYIASMKFQKYGPVIFKNVVDEKGIRSYIMVQIKETPATVDEPFKFDEVLQETNCIVVRFNGPERMLPIAQSKGAVFAYENDMVLNGTTYTVIKEKKDGEMAADLFFCA